MFRPPLDLLERMLRACKLEVWKEGSLVEEFDLSVPRSYIAGRADTADIRMDHISCSRRHAEIQVDASGLVSISDLNSAQGTWADNMELRPGEKCTLRDMSKLTFGSSTRVYLLKITMEEAGPQVGVAPTSQMSAQEKRKLLWGGKRAASGVSLSHQRTAEANSVGWATGAAALAGDSERHEKFLSMMGAKRHKPTGEDANPRPIEAAEAVQRQQTALFDTLEQQFHQAAQTQRGRRSL